MDHRQDEVAIILRGHSAGRSTRSALDAMCAMPRPGSAKALR